MKIILKLFCLFLLLDFSFQQPGNDDVINKIPSNDDVNTIDPSNNEVNTNDPSNGGVNAYDPSNSNLGNPDDDDVTDYEDDVIHARDSEYENFNPDNDKNILKPLDVGLAAVYGVITVVGLLANGVVFFVIFAGGEISKTVTAMYVLQLAVADSLFLMTLPIFGLQKLLMTWPFGRGLCSICIGLKFFNYYAGILFLTAMSVDRYIAVAYSTRSHQLRTRKRTMLVCAIVWVVAAVMTSPVLVYAQVVDIEKNQVCKLYFPGSEPLNMSLLYFYEDVNETSGDYYMVDDPYNGEGEEELNETDFYEGIYGADEYACKHENQGPSYAAWLFSNFVLVFIIPFVVITISYAMIVKQLRVSEDKVANMTGKRTANMRKRVTRMVLVLVICFVICWFPHQIFSLAKINGLNISAAACFAWEQILAALGFSNSAINPILYTFLGQNFGDRLRGSLARTRRRLRRGSSLPHTAHAHGGATNSENQHHNVSKRLSNFIGTRRFSKQSSDHGNSPAHSGSNGTKRGRIPLFEIKKNNGKRSRVTSEVENVTRSQLNQTECTGLMANDVRDTNVDDVRFSDVREIERQIKSV